VLIDKLP